MSKGDRNEIAAPYKPGVYMLTGVNGIGKSTVVDMIARNRPNTVPLHASSELRGLFGNVSREELELLTPEEKLGRMVTHFTTIFERHVPKGRAVIMDTHLLVPIRTGSVACRYEDIWSDKYSGYVKSVVMLSAHPEVLRHWRLVDEQATGRKRNTDINQIAADQRANIARFHELRSSGQFSLDRSGVVNNENGCITETTAAVEHIFGVH